MIARLLAILFLASTALGQLPPNVIAALKRSGAAAATASSWSPLSIANMAIFLNYNDCAKNISITNWYDEVQNQLWIGGSGWLGAFNTAQGMQCYQNRSGFGWNAGIYYVPPTTNTSIWCSFTTTNTANSYQTLWTANGYYGVWLKRNSSADCYVDIFTTSDTVLCKIQTNVPTDLVVLWGVPAVYTNGVSIGSVSISGISTNTIKVSTTGSDASGESFCGFIRFLGMWTNYTLTASDIANLHNWSATH